MEKFRYDFLADEKDRQAARQRAIQNWRKTRSSPPDRDRSPVLIGTDRELDRQRIQLLLRVRDNRRVTLPE